MKSLTTLILAAAAATIAAGSALAETRLQAEVPFAFRTAMTTMQPGSYQIKIGERGTVQLTNVDDHQSSFALPTSSRDAEKTWKKDGTPRVAFECENGKCALFAIYAGEDNSALQFSGLKSKNGDAHIAMIPATLIRK